MDLLCFCSVLCLLCLCLCAHLFICALWSPAGKRLTSLLSFVVSNCEFVTFPLVSWVNRNAKRLSRRKKKKPIAELNKPIPIRTLRNTRTSRNRPSSTVGKPTTTMLKTLSLEMTATQRSYGPSLKKRNVIVAASPH